MYKIENPALMEPMLPPEGHKELENLAFDLISKSSKLSGMLHGETVNSIGELVRSMNCYYSNLIEGHNTHPVDIERALNNEYAKDVEKRKLQLEAEAHIALQKEVDTIALPYPVTSKLFLFWLHKKFCQKLPPDFLINKDPITGKRVQIIPGEIRDGEVIIGSHIPPVSKYIPEFLLYFEKKYSINELSKVRQILAVAASHHRFLWIHPFYDGNGRVARLFSHAFLKEIGVGNPLWSISRGLARNVKEYKERLSIADSWRQDDLDGRGNLSMEGLINFCIFFINTCIDQIEFMEKLLEPQNLIERVRYFCSLEIEKKRLPKGSFDIIREIILTGSIQRSQASAITGYQERQARNVIHSLLKYGIIRAETVRSPLKLNIQHKFVDAFFPKLYPSEVSYYDSWDI